MKRSANPSLFWRLLISYLIVVTVSCVSMYLASETLSPVFLDFHLGEVSSAAGQLPDALHEQLEGDLEAAHSRAMQRALLWGMAVALLAASAVSLVVSSRIASPIRLLQHASRRIAAGSYHERLGARAPGEVAGLAAAFNDMAEVLEHTEARRVELLGNVAHEFRTPLSSLRGYIEGLQDDVFSATPETLSGCERQINRLERLVSDLSLLSRVEAGQEPVNPHPTQVNTLLTSAQRVFSTQFGKKGVRLTFAFAPPTLEVFADAQRTTQVLDNLLANALRHTPEGGEVSVSVRTLTKGEVEFSVSDTGDGVAEGELPHIFTRFYRGSNARRQGDGTGSGIGLTIAKFYVEAQGGKIGVRRASGWSSLFWFTLPERSVGVPVKSASLPGHLRRPPEGQA